MWQWIIEHREAISVNLAVLAGYVIGRWHGRSASRSVRSGKTL
jgi:hypothetical protein